MDSINKIVENLNEKQIEAVKSTEGYVRVIAGAGSGKTKALTSRYAFIVEGLGISSSNILCVTFTNKAAQEMRNRVKKLIDQNSDLIFITTYHGFCVRVLREDINKIQYPKSFVIMDIEDQKTILRQIYTELDLSQREYTFKQVLRFISKQKNNLQYLNYILESERVAPKSELDKIFHEYLFKQQKNFALDFDDLINFTIYIFDKHIDILNKWQKRFHYIQVDEAQDSSDKQFMLISSLAEFHKNLFIVGDPDQTIYEWRGARPEILVDFDKQFPTCQTIVLNQNYRSTPEILNLANQIIKKNKIRVDKDLFTKNPSGIEVVHFHAKNEIEESQWIVDEIREIKNANKTKLSDITILYRAHHVSRNIEQALLKENIPYSVFGGIRFFERKEIKDVLAYLRLIALGDDMSFLRIINYPKRGLGKKFIEKIINESKNEEKSLLNVLTDNIADNSFNRKGAEDFIELIHSLKEIVKSKSVSDFIKYLLDKTEILKELRIDGDEERLENIQELINSIIFLEKENDNKLELTDYLQEIALYTNKDVIEEEDGKVNLMTIHTAKGLEYPYVFLCGFLDGIIPSAMSIKEGGKRALEEERRLTYVAITRAEKSFYLTEAEGFNYRTGEQKYPSRFLFEIEDNMYVQKGVINKQFFREAKHHMIFENNRLEDSEIFSIGDLVNHPLWKLGEIISVNIKKEEYTVLFAEMKKTKPINFEYKFLKKVPDTKLKHNEEFIPKQGSKTIVKESIEKSESHSQKEIKGLWKRLINKIIRK